MPRTWSYFLAYVWVYSWILTKYAYKNYNYLKNTGFFYVFSVCVNSQNNAVGINLTQIQICFSEKRWLCDFLSNHYTPYIDLRRWRRNSSNGWDFHKTNVSFILVVCIPTWFKSYIIQKTRFSYLDFDHTLNRYWTHSTILYVALFLLIVETSYFYKILGDKKHFDYVLTCPLWDRTRNRTSASISIADNMKHLPAN